MPFRDSTKKFAKTVFAFLISARFTLSFALVVILSWYLCEVIICLAHSSRFWPLCWLIGPCEVLLLSATITAIYKTESRAIQNKDQGFTGIWKLIFLDLVVAAVALGGAYVLNPNYQFQYSPLLWFSHLLAKTLFG